MRSVPSLLKTSKIEAKTHTDRSGLASSHSEIPSVFDFPRRSSIWGPRPKTSGVDAGFQRRAEFGRPPLPPDESPRRITEDFTALHRGNCSSITACPCADAENLLSRDLLDTLQHSVDEHYYAESSDNGSDGHRVKRSFDQATTGFRTLVRRASNSMSSRFHTRPLKSRKGSQDTTAQGVNSVNSLGLDNTHDLTPSSSHQHSRKQSETTHPTPKPEKSSSSLRRAFSRKDRRSAFALQAGRNASAMELPQELSATLTSQQPPLPEAGSSARAAAAAYNLGLATNSPMDATVHTPAYTPANTVAGSNPYSWRRRLQDLDRGKPSTSISAPLKRSSSDYPDSCIEGSGMEGVVGPAGATLEGAHIPISTKDPVTVLPTEIALLVFSFLDSKSLASAERVSKSWHLLTSSGYVWREVFISKHKSTVHQVSPSPLQMGGLGLGATMLPTRNWKKMYQVRQKIEQNWRTGTPKAVYFSGHTDSVYCCQFDENKIITGSRDRTIRVWDLHTYKCLKVIGGPATRPVLPAADATILETHPTATISALPSVNGTPEGDAIYHIPSEFHSASILCLQFDNEIMVTGSSDNTCIIWDIKTFEPIKRLQHHTAGVLDVCFDSKYIISCSKDATICVWHRSTGELASVLQGHKGPVNAVQLRGNLLVSASGDGVAKLWDLNTMKAIKDFQSKDRGLAAVEFSDDARYVLAGGNDHVIYKFDARTEKLEHTYHGHSQLVRSLFLDSTNNRVLSGSYDQGIRVFDFQNGAEIAKYDNWTTSWILAAKSDYRRIVATSQDGRAVLMDFGHGIADVELLDGRA